MDIISTVKNLLGMKEEDKDLVTLITEGKIDKAKAKFTNREEVVKKSLEQWRIADHEIMKRANKTLKDGTIIESWNLPISYQKKIVQSAVAFMYAKPVKLKQESDGTDDVFQILTDLRKDLRMAAKDQENAKLMMSETESAKLFVPYRDSAADKKDLTKPNSIKCILLAKSLGDTLHTSFDSFGVLRAIAREYKVKVGINDIAHFDVYMSDNIFLCERVNGTWTVKTETNLIGKIPVVYYMQDEAEWADVQKLIERRETLTSRRADNNDRSGDPILVLEGEVLSLPNSKEVGKVVQMGIGGKAAYLVPQMSIDMVKDEKEDLKELIHYLTDTPDLSMDKMTGMGLTSGKAIEMAFFGCLLKAMGKHGYFEEMVDREINILKAFIGKVMDTSKAGQVEKLNVSIEFGNPLPDNIDDLVTMLSTATGGKPIMSQKTVVAKNPLVTNADEEFIQIGDESISTIE